MDYEKENQKTTEERIVDLETEVMYLKLCITNTVSKDRELSPFFEYMYKCIAQYQYEMSKSGGTRSNRSIQRHHEEQNQFDEET